MLTQSRLKELLHYDPLTGIFTRLKCACTYYIGKRAGNACKFHGYRFIKIDQVSYREHRVAWLYMHGVWPAGEIDHINRNGLDNRFSNLREADESQQACNTRGRKNTMSGVKGVTWVPHCGRWMGRVSHKTKEHYLGLFSTIEEAKIAVIAKRAELHGEYAFHE